MVTELLVGYQPTGPWIIQSGKYAGKTLEQLMLDEPGVLTWLLQKGRGRTDEFYLHLVWLLERGKQARPKMTCPQCYERPVAFFSVAYSQLGSDFTVGIEYTYCEVCKQGVDTITSPKPLGLFSFRFSTLDQFPHGSRRKQVADLFKKVYGLPTPLTREQAFQFFNSVEPCIE